MITTKCKKCGKIIDSITFSYGMYWICSDCTDDRESVLYCEKGCKVKAVRLDCGWESDIEQAKRFLIQDAVYEVESVEVGGYSSTVCLKEFPKEKFNTIHFIRC